MESIDERSYSRPLRIEDLVGKVSKDYNRNNNDIIINNKRYSHTAKEKP